MTDKKQFEKDNIELVEAVKKLGKEERDALRSIIRDYEDEVSPVYSCKKGDVVSFWSEWCDYSNDIVLDRIERCAIALDDCKDVRESLMLEYNVPFVGVEKECWRYEPVRAENFIGVIGHVDLSGWEAYTEKLWRRIYPQNKES